MRISLNGVNKPELLEKLGKDYELTVIKTTEDVQNPNFPIVDYASKTYTHFDKENVVFDGGVFDGLKVYDDEGLNELQDQIILSSLENVDVVVVITKDMPTNILNIIKEYQSIFVEKIKLFETYDDVVVY